MRISLSGKWRIAKTPALVLAVLGAVGVSLLAWVPKDLELVRIIGLIVGTFASGMLASQHAAIWEPSDK